MRLRPYIFFGASPRADIVRDMKPPTILMGRAPATSARPDFDLLMVGITRRWGLIGRLHYG